MTENKTLQDRIQTTFADVPWPGDDDLTDSTYGEEPAALIEAFTGKNRWQDLKASFLDPAPDGWGSALSFFSDRAFRFYLPAYLLADLHNKLEIQDPSFSLCMFVTPMGGQKKIAKVWGGGTMGEHARNRFEPFSQEQTEVIVDYLWWKLDRQGPDLTIEQALEHYWLPRVESQDN